MGFAELYPSYDDAPRGVRIGTSSRGNSEQVEEKRWVEAERRPAHPPCVCA